MAENIKFSNWEECLENNLCRKISKDIPRSKSLIDTANARIVFTKKRRYTRNEIKFVFEAYYTSILELIHALLSIKGFKTDAHYPCGYFLRDILKKDSLYRIFDDARIKRNSLVYYGKDIDFEILSDTLKDLEKLFSELLNELKKLN